MELYNSIVSVIQDLRADAYNPDYVIMNPNVSKRMYFKDGSGYFNTPLVTFADGHLIDIAGVKVIESCVANDCVGTGGKEASTDTWVSKPAGIMAVIIDSSRAIGEVWGKKPTFSQFYDAKCDGTELVLWQYWGTSAMDLGAIGYVANP
jgi:hypothetical protein